ncbi:hypothetical protein M959_13326, partial [Chaetura pelagica]
SQCRALLLCSSKAIFPNSWLSSSALLTGSWKKFISAAKAAMAEGSWPNCARSIMSIFSRRRLSLLASRSRISRACRQPITPFMGVPEPTPRQDDPDLLNVAWLVKRAPQTAQFDSWSSEWMRRCRPRDPGELRALPHTGHM